MSEKFPSSAVSHAELDKDLYQTGKMTEASLLDARAEAATINRVKEERYRGQHERKMEEAEVRRVADGALRAYERTRYDAQYARQAAEREQAATEDGAMRAYIAKRDGHNTDPTAAFRAKQAEYEAMDRALEEDGKVDTLNRAFAHEIEKVTDEAGVIDVDKLNSNDLIRYKTGLGPLVGEDAGAYDKRMTELFGTSNYMDALVHPKLIDANDAWSLKRIAENNPGDNPLADLYKKKLQEQVEAEAQ